MIPSLSPLATLFTGATGTGQLKDVSRSVSGEPGPISTQFDMNSAGTTSEAWNWLLTGPAANFEVMVSPTSGAFTGTSSAVNTWLSLSTSRSWVCRQNAVGTKTVFATVQLRLVGSTDILATASLGLSAVVTGAP